MFMRMLPSNHIPALALIALSALLSGCASKPVADDAAVNNATGVQFTEKSGGLFGFLKPYRIDVQQGNFVSKEMVAQLKPGMTREQVRFVLGTPLLTDLFHAERWDYDFRLVKGNGSMMSSRVSVFFKDNLLERYEGGDNLPSEQEYLSLINSGKKGALPEVINTPTPSPDKK